MGRKSLRQSSALKRGQSWGPKLDRPLLPSSGVGDHKLICPHFSCCILPRLVTSTDSASLTISTTRFEQWRPYQQLSSPNYSSSPVRYGRLSTRICSRTILHERSAFCTAATASELTLNSLCRSCPFVGKSTTRPLG